MLKKLTPMFISGAFERITNLKKNLTDASFLEFFGFQPLIEVHDALRGVNHLMIDFIFIEANNLVVK